MLFNCAPFCPILCAVKTLTPVRAARVMPVRRRPPGGRMMNMMMVVMVNMIVVMDMPLGAAHMAVAPSHVHTGI